MRTDDARAIFDGYAQDEKVAQYLRWYPHASIDQTESYIRMCLAAVGSRAYVIVLKATGKVIGVFHLRKTGPAELGFGFALAHPFWGRGLMPEALTEVINWALRQTSIWQICGAADIDNSGSIRVMEKAGLQREEAFRKPFAHSRVGLASRNYVVFSKTR